MTPLRVIIVDDEEPARERLRLLLGECVDVIVVGEAADGQAALEAVAAAPPDVLFLDVQMPGVSGLEVAAALPAPRPRVVFCTAFDRFAVDAFELHAVDYLLKPVSRARLATTIERLRAGADDADAAVRAAASVKAGAPSRFLARRANRWFVVPATDVVAFLSEDSLTRLTTADAAYWVAPTLNDLEERLDGTRFFRASRAAIVNLDAVTEVVPQTGGLGEIVLRNGTRMEVSRRRFRTLIERLG